MRNQTFGELEVSDQAEQRPDCSAGGIEVIEYFVGPQADGDVLEFPGQQTTRASNRQGAGSSRESGPARAEQLERERLRLEDELVRVRKEADRRIREQEDRIASLLTHLNEREYELWEKESKIASLTLAYDGLRERVGEDAGPTVGIAVGFIEGQRRGGDVIESLKARLKERGRAIRVLREELDAVNRDRARLARALGERGQQVAQLLEQLTRSEVVRGFGMDFRSGLRGLFQRDPVVATQDNDSPAWNAPVDGERTLVLDSPEAPSQDVAVCDTQAGAAGERGVEIAAPAVRGSQDAAPPAKAAGVKLRRYLLPLSPDVDPVFELSGPRSYVGRGFVADVCISHPTISRLHAVLYWVGGATVLEDTRSSNGVFVNRKRVQQAVLKDGDVVAFGNVEFNFRVTVSDS
jgi:hypothetical protein